MGNVCELPPIASSYKIHDEFILTDSDQFIGALFSLGHVGKICAVELKS